MSTKRIERGWDNYRCNVIPADAPQVQVEETRNGFYAGAWCFFSALLNDLDEGTEATTADGKLLAELHEELQAFARSKRG